MDNSTATKTVLPFGEESSTIFSGLTKTEEVAIIASIVVGGLAVCAVILRFTMPLIRRKCRKSKDPQPALNGNKSTSDLLGSANSSTSPSRASTISSASVPMNYWKPGDTDTAIMTISSSSHSNPKSSVFGNLRSGGLSLPVYLPRAQSEGAMKSAYSQQLLNEELTSVISTPTLQRLQSLSLHEVYRDNWDRTFDPSHQHARSLSHVTHPSESRRVPEIPEVHRPMEHQRHSTTPDEMTRF